MSDILFHGSKGGLIGRPTTSSRATCDFGKGFYLGSNKNQCCSLIADHSSPILYSCTLNTQNLSVKQLDGVLWTLFIMKNRGFMEEFSNTVLLRQLEELSERHDVFIGKIADDRLTQAFDLFAEGLLSFNGLFACISELSLGIQTVCVTQKACDAISIISSKQLSGSELVYNRQISTANRQRGSEIFTKYKKYGRSNGVFVDEFMGEYKNGLPSGFI